MRRSRTLFNGKVDRFINPTGYACGQATRSSDNSRLDKNCAKGFFCPISFGPQPNDILVEKLPESIAIKTNAVDLPTHKCTMEAFAGRWLNHTVISVSFDGIETYEAGKYVNRQYKHIWAEYAMYTIKLRLRQISKSV